MKSMDAPVGLEIWPDLMLAADNQPPTAPMSAPAPAGGPAEHALLAVQPPLQAPQCID